MYLLILMTCQAICETEVLDSFDTLSECQVVLDEKWKDVKGQAMGCIWKEEVRA